MFFPSSQFVLLSKCVCIQCFHILILFVFLFNVFIKVLILRIIIINKQVQLQKKQKHITIKTRNKNVKLDRVDPNVADVINPNAIDIINLNVTNIINPNVTDFILPNSTPLGLLLIYIFQILKWQLSFLPKKSNVFKALLSCNLSKKMGNNLCKTFQQIKCIFK